MRPFEKARELGIPKPSLKTLSELTGKSKRALIYIHDRDIKRFESICKEEAHKLEMKELSGTLHKIADQMIYKG